MLPNQHFRKEWAERVKTWLDQPKRKERRRRARKAKAAALAPRPLDKLRPVVRCQTVRYNMRVRAGRGFTLEELKAAGINARVAATVGISVDHRRLNKSEESLKENVARLQAFMAKLAVYPRNSGKAHVRKGEVARAEVLKVAAAGPSSIAAAFPIRQAEAKITFATVGADLKDPKKTAYIALRQARTNKKLEGRRKKAAAEKAAAPAVMAE